RMYSGEVSASRDLQAMASEVKALEAKRSDLDDQALALLEELEPIEAELNVLATDRRPLEEEVANALAALAAAESLLDVEIQAERQARDSAASGLDPELLARYEKLRQRLGGVGAARLVNGSCSGCHLAFSAAELNQIQRSPKDVVITCEQCGRILVH
ncbi:MAG: zinc ribbon domain-containing protein, partial [Acidimicrobiales bacterium]